MKRRLPPSKASPLPLPFEYLVRLVLPWTRRPPATLRARQPQFDPLPANRPARSAPPRSQSMVVFCGERGNSVAADHQAESTLELRLVLDANPNTGIGTAAEDSAERRR